MGYKKAADGSQIIATQRLTLGQQSFRRTDDNTEVMNISGLSNGTLINVWNGTGASDTGADWTVSGAGSQTTAADAGTGTNGWDTGITALNGSTIFNNGSMIDVVGSYSSLQFQMEPRSFPLFSVARITFLDNLDAQIGNSLNISSYTTNMDLNVLQQVSIPIADFGLTGDVQKIRFRYEGILGQRFYFDDIKLVTSSAGPYTFQVKSPDEFTQYHVSMIVFVVSGSSSGWNSGSFANIPALEAGLLLRQRNINDSSIIWSLNSKDNVDLFGRYHPQDDVVFSDGTMLVGFMILPGRSSVIVTNVEALEFIVRDDLSSLTSARAFVHYGVEIIE